jgi:ArsR family transcriptional regulator
MNNALLASIKDRFARRAPACARVIRTLALLSNKTRFRIACSLSQADLTVSELVQVAGGSKQSNVSLQLRLMTAAGILACRRSGKSSIYSLADENLRSLIRFLERTYG